jgi:hypothetical protein
MPLSKVPGSQIDDSTITQAKLGANVSGNGPAFSAYAATGVSMANSVPTKILFQTEDFDTNSNYDATTARFLPTVAGYYQVTATMSAPTSASAYFNALIYKNGVLYATSPLSGAVGIYVSQVTALVYCNGSTDYIEAYGSQSSGGTITSNTGTSYKFQGCMVRAA